MKTLTDFNSIEIQENVKSFWKEANIYATVKTNLKGREKYYFVDGPPYTSGQVHLGTAWNKALKDMLLRIKRMQGFDVWDRAGYDMHGLPIEHAAEKELGIKGAKEIQAYGVDRFIEACKELAIRNMNTMNEVFVDLGVWMDFENAYQTLDSTYMDGEWWFIKQAHEKNRLYEGLRTTMWDAKDATAVAKHETEYKSVEDKAIFVKFPVKHTENEFLLIWTTTPWTIPFNLAVMVNPEFDYELLELTVDGKKERWWIATDLKESVLAKLEVEAKTLQIVKGEQLEGKKYTHPFADDLGFKEMEAQYEKLHSVLLSKEYVDTSAGSGLVHCAPGCGPEDFEVGYRNGLPAFNLVDVHGAFQNAGQFTNLQAKKDDAKFIEIFEANGALVHQHSYVHDYPHAERSKEPVIFRTTKQWFIKIDDIKEQLIRENDEVNWLPKAGYNAFNAWLENLRDNSISKQRFWGTPIPVWRNVDDENDYFVVGSKKELEELSGKTLDDLHISTVDKIEIVKEGKTYRRIKDVLDVWVDAGTALWNCLRMSELDEIEYTPIEFIVEGKDQIRGWFNLLHVCSNVMFGKKAFKNCYMHGYINDTSGRKMSKSLQNYIRPAEVTEKYGVDTFRFYVIGGTNPGLDLNYNFEDVDLRKRNLNVLWNVHKYAVDLAKTYDLSTLDLPEVEQEEEYIFSKLHSMIKMVNQKADEYKLNEIPSLVEDFFLDLSRTYIQLIREKVSNGTQDQKQTVFATLVSCLDAVVKLLAPITPFVADQLYHNLKEMKVASFDKQSVHLENWPTFDESKINTTLEDSFVVAQKVITAGLAARDVAKLGVRWPSKNIVLDVDETLQTLVKNMSVLIKQQLNVKDVVFEKIPVQYVVKPNYRVIGKSFGQQTADVITLLKDKQKEQEVANAISAQKETFTVGGFNLTPDMFDVEAIPRDGATVILFDEGKLELNTVITPELEAEGFSREVTRRLQNLRKTSGMEKADEIAVQLVLGDLPEAVLSYKETIMQVCGAKEFAVVVQLTFEHQAEEKVKGKSFSLALKKV